MSSDFSSKILIKNSIGSALLSMKPERKINDLFVIKEGKRLAHHNSLTNVYSYHTFFGVDKIDKL